MRRRLSIINSKLLLVKILSHFFCVLLIVSNLVLLFSSAIFETTDKEHQFVRPLFKALLRGTLLQENYRSTGIRRYGGKQCRIAVIFLCKTCPSGRGLRGITWSANEEVVAPTPFSLRFW